MPGVVGIGEFIEETREDYNSPTTSTFVSRMPQFRQTISALEEVIMVIRCQFIYYQDKETTKTLQSSINCQCG